MADQTYESSRQIRPGDVVEDAHGSLFLRATGSNWVSLRGAQEPQGALLRLVPEGPPDPLRERLEEVVRSAESQRGLVAAAISADYLRRLLDETQTEAGRG